jgi:hypothetical protein
VEVSPGLEAQVLVSSRERDSTKGRNSSNSYLLHGSVQTSEGFVQGDKFLDDEIFLGTPRKRLTNLLNELEPYGCL